MADLNKVFLMGRLTFDPELRRTPSGSAVTELRLATSRSWAGRDGERKEETLFIDVTVWDRQAETCCQYLKKGRAVHVEGYLKMDSWEDKNTGEKRSKVKVQAPHYMFEHGLLPCVQGNVRKMKFPSVGQSTLVTMPINFS